MRQIRHIHLAAVGVTAAASLGVAACGGGSSPPGVASLSGSGHGNSATTTTLPKGSATQLLDEWANCMRQHGDPNQPDPTIDANRVIHITIPSGNQPEDLKSSNSPCSSFLTAAQIDLGGNRATQRPNFSKLLAFSRCMRSHGVHDFPDPSPGGGLSIQAGPNSDLNPSSPTFKAASTTCGRQTGVSGFGSTPSPGSIEATGGGPGPGASGGPGGGRSQSLQGG